MKDVHKQELIEYRLQQAHETLDEAAALFEKSFWRGAINRSYYAMFYAVLALAVLRQQVTSKHSGVIAFFDREFVKTDIFPPELSRSLHLAFDRRQTNDYGEIFTVTEDEAWQAIEDARIFITSISNYLESIVS